MPTTPEGDDLILAVSESVAGDDSVLTLIEQWALRLEQAVEDATSLAELKSTVTEEITFLRTSNQRIVDAVNTHGDGDPPPP